MTISSTFIPSASALKLGRILWRKISGASDCISSMLGVGLPSNKAFAFAPRTRYCEALGPAPHSTHFFTYSLHVFSFGLVEAANFTA